MVGQYEIQWGQRHLIQGLSAGAVKD